MLPDLLLFSFLLRHSFYKKEKKEKSIYSEVLIPHTFLRFVVFISIYALEISLTNSKDPSRPFQTSDDGEYDEHCYCAPDSFPVVHPPVLADHTKGRHKKASFFWTLSKSSLFPDLSDAGVDSVAEYILVYIGDPLVTTVQEVVVVIIQWQIFRKHFDAVFLKLMRLILFWLQRFSTSFLVLFFSSRLDQIPVFPVVNKAKSESPGSDERSLVLRPQK